MKNVPDRSAASVPCMHSHRASVRPLASAARWICSALLLASSAAMADTRGEIGTPLEALANTAAVIEARVSEQGYAFDPATGPRTLANLVEVVAHLGRFDGRSLTVATLGGPLDDGRWLFIPELPRLHANARYLLLLNNTDWFFSPIVGDYLFRLERGADGSDVLLDREGRTVCGINERDLVLAEPREADGTVEITNGAKPALVQPAACAMPKERFLAALAELTRSRALQGSYQPLPTAGRAWNRNSVAPATGDTRAAEERDTLVCADSATTAGAACRDSSDQ